MNSEFSASIERAVTQNPSQPPWAEEAIDEINFAKHPTLAIDAEARSGLEMSPELMPDSKPSYVQGVLQGKQVYLITNLLSHRSKTLLQPQMVWTIGRNRAAALPLQDRKLSRRHAVILYTPDQGFYLIDLNSMNGSYVNGVRVQQRRQLQDGDYICLGSTRFFFFISVQEQLVESIHPEVLTRLNNLKTRTTPFIDFSELHEEISFNVIKSD